MQPQIRSNQNLNKKDWIKGIILIIAWILIFSLIKDLWQVKKGFSRIEEAKNRLKTEEVKNQMLKDKLKIVMTEEYKEKMIREQLNMQKIGEVVAVLPKGESFSIKEMKEEQSEENWEKWWALIR